MSVFTRILLDRICRKFTAQKSRLVSRQRDFSQRDTEVPLVFLYATEQLPQFKNGRLLVASEEPDPFSVLLGRHLQAVGDFDVHIHFAKPLTLVSKKTTRSCCRQLEVVCSNAHPLKISKFAGWGAGSGWFVVINFWAVTPDKQ